MAAIGGKKNPLGVAQYSPEYDYGPLAMFGVPSQAVMTKSGLASPVPYSSFTSPSASSESSLSKYEREQQAKEIRDQQRAGQRRNAQASARGGRRSTLLTDAMDELNTLLGGSLGAKTLLGF